METSKYDKIFKLLIALEIALLPLIIAMNLFFGSLVMILVFIALLLARFWLIFLNDANNNTHNITLMVADAIVCTFVLFLLYGLNYISLAVCLIAVILFLGFLAAGFIFKKTIVPEIVKAVDICTYIFIFVGFALAFIEKAREFGNICLISCMLTAGFSIIFKIVSYFRVKRFSKNPKQYKTVKTYSYKKKK